MVRQPFGRNPQWRHKSVPVGRVDRKSHGSSFLIKKREKGVLLPIASECVSKPHFKTPKVVGMTSKQAASPMKNDSIGSYSACFWRCGGFVIWQQPAYTTEHAHALIGLIAAIKAFFASDGSGSCISLNMQIIHLGVQLI